jgi:mycothione reductase
MTSRTGLHYDLVIVGAGSGNMVPTEEFAGWRIAVVESDRFGGTCLNRGCIPSKMLTYTADVARTVANSRDFGIEAELHCADWPAIRSRIFDRLDPKNEEAIAYRRAHGIDVFLDEARFVDSKVLRVGTEDLHADQFVLATGSRPVIPPIPGLEDLAYLTTDSVMRLDFLPSSMIVLGGGCVAAEMSHIFGALGTQITIIEQADQMLSNQDVDIRTRFTELNRQRCDLRLGATVTNASMSSGQVRLDFTTAGNPQFVTAETILVATGREPNTDRLAPEAAGIELDSEGRIKVDVHYRTSASGIWAFGDLVNHFGLKHMANAEGRVVQHNLLHPDDLKELPFSVVPAAVFADPQIASVGLTEDELKDQGRRYICGKSPYSDSAYGWALEDTTSFVKVLADPDSRLLLGAHIMGPQASLLIQPLLQAMCLGNTVNELAHGVLYIHPALSEAVAQALLSL